MSDTTTTPLEEFLDEERDAITADMLRTNMTAIASAETGELDAAQSAIASLTTHGDANVSTSVIGLLNGVTTNVKQSLAGAVVADANASVSQSVTPAIVARHVETTGGASAVTVAEDVTATKSWIGLMATHNATLSEDSRVIIDWKGAVILGLFLLGGFGIVAVVAWFASRRVIGALADVRDSLHLPDRSAIAHLPHVPEWVGKVVAMRHAA